MTKIKFFKNLNNFVGFECSGHTGYGESGNDVLCASISSITQMTALGLKDVCKIDVIISRNDDKGYLKVELPKVIKKEELLQSQVLFQTLYESIKDLISGYSEYIFMEVIEDVY